MESRAATVLHLHAMSKPLVQTVWPVVDPTARFLWRGHVGTNLGCPNSGVPRVALARQPLAVGKGYRQALVVLCPRSCPLYSASGVPRCHGMVRDASQSSCALTLTPTPTLTLSRRGAECRHPICCEKMGSLTLQSHQYPILLLPWLWFEV